MTTKKPARTPVVNDPYRRCEESCTHDLASGVLTPELLNAEGPFQPDKVAPLSGDRISRFGTSPTQDERTQTSRHATTDPR